MEAQEVSEVILEQLQQLYAASFRLKSSYFLMPPNDFSVPAAEQVPVWCTPTWPAYIKL